MNIAGEVGTWCCVDVSLSEMSLAWGTLSASRQRNQPIACLHDR
jgi:hypothetical protein